MHYQDSDFKTDLKSEEVFSFMRSEFVNFDDIVDIDDGMYDALGDFAIYLRNGIMERSLSEENLQKAFRIMNTMGASKELEVQNLLVVGLFEIFTDEEEVIANIKHGLEGAASELFDRVIIGWNNG